MIIGVSGASGSIYGYRLLERLRKQKDVETHLILTRSAERTAFLESGRSADEFQSSGQFSLSAGRYWQQASQWILPDQGMVIAPCSIHSMSAIAAGLSSNLLLRAADVCLKERRKLILMVRETPLHLGHLRSMVTLTEMGAIILPPVPGFYNRPKTILDIVDHTVDRVLDLLNLPAPDARRWDGGSIRKNKAKTRKP